MFVYALNHPCLAQLSIDLAAAGRIKIILDNDALRDTQPGKPTTEEDDFEVRFNAAAAPGAELFRCRFGRYSHCKIIILKKNGAAFRVLTGSTNFAITGICVNANHVLLFDRPNLANYYSDVFNNVWQVGKATPFRTTDFSTRIKKFSDPGLPHTEINFSPHDDTRAAEVRDEITTFIQKPSI